MTLIPFFFGTWEILITLDFHEFKEMRMCGILCKILHEFIDFQEAFRMNLADSSSLASTRITFWLVM